MGASDWKNLKIAILTPTFYEYSGIDRLVENEAEELKKDNNEVTIFTFSATIRTKNAMVIRLGMPKTQTLERIYRLFFFLDIPKLIKYTRALRSYDIVISHFYPLNILPCQAKFFRHKFKYIYHNAGVVHPELFQRFSERLYLRLFRFLNNLTIKNADEIISISKYLSEELKKETGLDSRVVYPTIDKRRFHKNSNGYRIRKRFKLEDSLVILYVGRISPHKGVHLLLESFKLARVRIKNIKLVIVGKATFSGYFEKLKEIAGDASRDIIFAGYIPDEELQEFYSACDVYVSASLWEGFNLPLAEAQACGKPVVAFDLCSHPEVVRDGILVKPNDTSKFAEAIVKILEKKHT